MTEDVARLCWCGASAARPADTIRVDDLELRLVRCVDCGVSALHPQPDQQTLESSYGPDYYGSSSRKFIRPIARLVSRIQDRRARQAARELPPGGRVLDVGCGSGEFLHRMKRLGFDVTGTEWTRQSAARVPAHLGVPVSVGELLDLHLPSSHFDLVTVWHVLEHVRNPEGTLQEIHRLLKPDGRVILAMPNAESWQAMRFRGDWFHHDPPRHLFAFGRASLSRLLDQTGFQIDRVTGWSWEQNPFGFIQSWLNARGYPRDRVYTRLKGLQSGARGQLADFAWLAALTLPALAHSVLEAASGHGATMTVNARRR